MFEIYPLHSHTKLTAKQLDERAAVTAQGFLKKSRPLQHPGPTQRPEVL